MNPIRRLASLLLFVVFLAVSQSSAAANSFDRQDVTFTSVGKKLVGWLYVPNGMKQGEKRPTIVMAVEAIGCR